MSSLTCACATALVGVTNDACSQELYGNQIVKIFVQKMNGTTFDGGAGNDATVEADWDTKIAAVDDDKIVSIPNLSNAVRSSSSSNTESGNEVPYGGEEIIDKPQEMSFDLKYFDAATFAAIDQTQCWGKVRVWLLDNNDYLWGTTLAVAATSGGDGILDVSILTTTFGQGGIGTRNKQEGNKISWNDLCQPLPIGQFAFLKDK